jgi:hypothetical protein
MKSYTLYLVIAVLAGLIAGMYLGATKTKEGFAECAPVPTTPATPKPCAACGTPVVCAPCPAIDYSKYVLKSSVPAPATCPDMSRYMLKSECPSVPDLSKYVLKSSIPKQAPVILDCSKCTKPKGECPPCPRARCPEVKCPPPTTCAPCAPCPRSVCPEKTVRCKAEDTTPSTVRPYLSPLGLAGYGLA